ncbi:hypothetical protein BTR23_14255 [Alkalihalophilus pseudofirmus]|nr:hypothetical protein BTR23_14255 [Alkalihalophilus pseudofirmus]
MSTSSNNWILNQTWKNLLFLHWPVHHEHLEQHIPKQLQIDSYRGIAWISIVLLMMDSISLKAVPFSIFPAFPEINVRTYVVYNNEPGVFFLSLDAEHWSTYTLAKKWYRLPYYHSEISFYNDGSEYTYESIRRDKTSVNSLFHGTFSTKPEVFYAKPNTLEYWLLERYHMFSADHSNHIYSTEISHRPWPLQLAEVEIKRNTLLSSLHIFPSDIKPKVQFSSGVKALITNIKKQ